MMGWDASVLNPTEAALNDFEREGSALRYRDCLLVVGGLHLKGCAQALERACGMDVYVEQWSPEDVKRAHEHATWADDMYNASAQVFLSICAKHNLGISFSW